MTYPASGRGVFETLHRDRGPEREEWADRPHPYARDRGDPEDRCACKRKEDDAIHTEPPPQACGHTTRLRSGCREGAVQCALSAGHAGPHRNVNSVEWENETPAGEPELQRWLRERGLEICRMQPAGGGGSSVTAANAIAVAASGPGYWPIRAEEYRALEEEIAQWGAGWA